MSENVKCLDKSLFVCVYASVYERLLWLNWQPKVVNVTLCSSLSQQSKNKSISVWEFVWKRWQEVNAWQPFSSYQLWIMIPSRHHKTYSVCVVIVNRGTDRSSHLSLHICCMCGLDGCGNLFSPHIRWHANWSYKLTINCAGVHWEWPLQHHFASLPFCSHNYFLSELWDISIIV